MKNVTSETTIKKEVSWSVLNKMGAVYTQNANKLIRFMNAKTK